MITKQQKVELVEELRTLWKNSGGLIFSDTQMLTAAATQELRTEIHKAGLNHKVFKNTLIELVAKEMGIAFPEKLLTGPTAVTFANDDAPAAAKIIADFQKKFPKKMSLKGGFSEGQVFDQSGVQALANAPSRPQLLGMLANVLNSPIVGIARVLNANIEGLARVINAVKEEKEKAA